MKRDQDRGGERVRYDRGYVSQLTPRARAELKTYEQTCLPCSLFWVLAYYLTIAGVVALALWVFSAASLWAAGVAYLLALLAIARQQRGLELMVHDASHGAWYRSSRRVNHLIANVLVAYPLLSTVEGYWESHRLHHGRYGSELDPCRRRFELMGLGEVDLSTTLAVVKTVLRWLPSYNAEYYREIGSRSPRVVGFALLWHALVFVLPLSLAFGLMMALLIWALFWIMPALTTLPVLRSVAEAEEHDYDRAGTEFGTTFTNCGWIHQWYFHPWNDAYHLIHHMFPAIPQRVHHEVHAFLMENDATYRAGLHRTSVLEKV